MLHIASLAASPTHRIQMTCQAAEADHSLDTRHIFFSDTKFSNGVTEGNANKSYYKSGHCGLVQT